MVGKEELVGLYEKAILSLANQRKDELKFYVKQEAFSHMSLAVAFWHSDIYWNISEKSDGEFEEHEELDNQEFIIATDYTEDDADVLNLCNEFESWEDEKLSDDEDESMDLFFKLAHESLALALKGDKVKPLFEDILKENPTYKSEFFNEMVRVEDTDGRFDHNYMNVV